MQAGNIIFSKAVWGRWSLLQRWGGSCRDLAGALYCTLAPLTYQKCYRVKTSTLCEEWKTVPRAARGDKLGAGVLGRLVDCAAHY
ncbi:hypothetical protein NDU88_004323 [Pleurodeles waltl]|uniref:Uncharacterized protein n=1 Tax=Pleurodeles waltl TaxID=8319 RepID=A0AAV7LI74_PLEWA|nr:hypothetical protein NDU88_004323 [Pleurodeles waltl]